MAELTNIKAIKEVFENGIYGRKVSMAELKALSVEERANLGALCRKHLDSQAEGTA